MPRPRSISDQEILENARHYFVKYGHTASVKGLATQLDVSHAALFQRFGSKKELMIKALAPPPDLNWPTSLTEGPQKGQEYEGLLSLCQTMSAFFKQHSPCIRVIQAAGILPEEVFAQGRPFPMVAMTHIQNWIDLGIERQLFIPCDSQSVAMAVVGSLFARAQMDRLIASRNDLPLGMSADSSSHTHRTQLGSLEGLASFILRGLQAFPLESTHPSPPNLDPNER